MAHVCMDETIQFWSGPNLFPNQKYTFNEILSSIENVSL